MKTTKIPTNLYFGAGWAVAAINEETGEIVDLKAIEHPDNRTMDAVVDELDAEMTEKGLGDMFTIRGGMCSTTEFCFNFSKADRKSAHVKNAWI